MTRGVPRRQFTKGAVWAVPAISVAASAPALAVSPQPTLTSYTVFSQANASGASVNPYSCGGNKQYQVSGQAAGTYLTISNTVKGSAITNVSITFWLPTASGTTWTAAPGSSTCWSAPTATGATTTYSGATYRAYQSNFSCSAVAAGTSYSIPTSQMFNWVSSCQPTSSLNPATYHYTETATTVQGVTVTKDNGWSNVMS